MLTDVHRNEHQMAGGETGADVLDNAARIAYLNL
jgi:hypothetical protein